MKNNLTWFFQQAGIPLLNLDTSFIITEPWTPFMKPMKPIEMLKTSCHTYYSKLCTPAIKHMVRFAKAFVKQVEKPNDTITPAKSLWDCPHQAKVEGKQQWLKSVSGLGIQIFRAQGLGFRVMFMFMKPSCTAVHKYAKQYKYKVVYMPNFGICCHAFWHRDARHLRL